MVQDKIFILSGHSTDANLLWQVAVDNKWSIYRIGFNPEDKLKTIPPEFRIAYYGGTLLGQKISNYYNLSLLEPSLDWLLTIPEEYLGRKVEYLKISSFKQYNVPKFIKNADNKWFPARILNANGIPDFNYIDHDFYVYVQDIVNFRYEYRCFILNRELMDMSIYPENKFYTNNPINEAKQFIKKILNDGRIKIPISAVIDIGLTTEDKWLIVESNPSFASGIYNCAPELVFKTIIEASIKDEDLTDENKKFVFRKGDYDG